jgi:hypothetical protein
MSPEQPALPLQIPDSFEPDLRAAFASMAIAKKMSFAEAMAKPALAIGIRNTAEAVARRKHQGEGT